MADDAEAEAGEGAEEEDTEHDRGVARNGDVAAQFGDEHEQAGGDGEEQRRRAGIEQDADGQVGEVEDTVQGVAQLFAERPGALAFEARLALVDDVLAAVAEPEEERDEVGIDAVEAQELVADFAGAAEDIDSAGRHVADDELAIKEPEEVGGGLGEPRIAAAAADAEDDIGASTGERFEELEDQRGRLLQVRGHDGERVAAGAFEAGGDGGEGAEVAAEREQLGAEREGGQAVAEDFETAVGTAIDDEDDFELARHLGGELHEFGEQPVQIGFVFVDRNDQGVHWSALTNSRNSE